MDCQAKTTFETSNVVLEDIRILVEIDGFQSELSETFTSVGVGRGLRGYTTSSKFGACAILKIALAMSIIRRAVIELT